MSTEYAPSGVAAASATAGLEATSVLRAPVAAFVATPDVAVTVADESPGDVVRWGPIVAGVVTAFTVLLFMTVLGIALGRSALVLQRRFRPEGLNPGQTGACRA